MAGHWFDRLYCFLRGHQEMLWKCGASGSSWLCPRCGHEELSAVLRRVK